VLAKVLHQDIKAIAIALQHGTNKERKIALLSLQSHSVKTQLDQ
jgi:hypothetical protein